MVEEDGAMEQLCQSSGDRQKQPNSHSWECSTDVSRSAAPPGGISQGTH